MVRHRVKEVHGKWIVMRHVGIDHFAPIKGEEFDTEKEANKRRDKLKEESK